MAEDRGPKNLNTSSDEQQQRTTVKKTRLGQSTKKTNFVKQCPVPSAARISLRIFPFVQPRAGPYFLKGVCGPKLCRRTAQALLTSIAPRLHPCRTEILWETSGGILKTSNLLDSSGPLLCIRPHTLECSRCGKFQQSLATLSACGQYYCYQAPHG